MNIGQPSLFYRGDSPEELARKLNDTFADIWRLFQRVDRPAVAVAAEAKQGFCHTSEMPDTNSVNRDHDRRYYVNGGALRPRRIDQGTEPTPHANELLLWYDTTSGDVWVLYNDRATGVVKVQLT